MKFFLGKHDLHLDRGLRDRGHLKDSAALLMRSKSKSTSGRINVKSTSSRGLEEDHDVMADLEKMKYSYQFLPIKKSPI